MPDLQATKGAARPQAKSSPKPRFLPKFPVFVQDILASLRWQQMSPEERGCYMHLLFLEWQEGKLPGDPRVLLRLGGLLGTPEDHWLVVEAFPVGDDGARRNAKLERVRAETESFYAEQARKSVLGVAARTHGQPTGHPRVNPRSTPPTPTPTPTPTLTPTLTPTPSSESDSVPTEPAADKPLRASKPRKPASGPGAVCMRHWEAEWERTRLGVPWAWDRRDPSVVNRLLGELGRDPQDVCVRMTRMLEDSDGWWLRNARPALLEGHWNRFSTTITRADNGRRESPGAQAVRSIIARQGGAQ